MGRGAAGLGVRDGGAVAAVFAAELAEVGEEVDFADAAAVELDGGRGPEFAHAVAAPDLDALRPGLEHGQQDDAAGAVVAVETRELGPAADVGGLVEHR